MYLKALQKNDVIDLVCPASVVTKAQLFKIKKYLESLDLKANVFFEEELFFNKIVNHEMPLFAAQLRFKQLIAAIENPNSSTIWCLRGGHGSADLLPFLKKIKPIKQEKNFIGFGDLTSLTDFFYKNWGWQNICAPMLLQLTEKKLSFDGEKTLSAFLFKKKIPDYEILPLNPIAENVSSIFSEIVGGAFNVISSHFGTDNAMNFADKFLFLEDDRFENGERLDKYFQQLVEVILKEKITPKAVILGNFLEANPFLIKRKGGLSAKGYAVELAIKRFITKIEENNLNIAIFKEKTGSLGHSHHMTPLILGAKTKIEKSNKKNEEKFSLTIS